LTLDSNVVLREDLYYLVDDDVSSIRLTINTPLLLYIALAIQPALTAFIPWARLLMYSTPLSSSFGITGLGAAVRVETLQLLKGASLSGELRERLSLRIAVQTSATSRGMNHACNEYSLGDSSLGRLP